ncbi:MAG: carboxypeptidase-like regulatory domain-containing protein [Lachnospiraceae bacterium]|nr:carboxypeptidase-like regulatory domain-containing protein [Lachnospiraceae bacterium]
MMQKDKKHKYGFSVTMVGVLIYSVALIAVMVASYVGVKAIFRNHDLEVAAKTQAETEKEEIRDEEEKPSPTPAPDTEKTEENIPDHVLPLDELMDPETGIVDYSVEMFKPGKRNADLKWKDSVFSRIENVKDPANAPVNTYTYRRVSVKLTNNDISEYKVYINPENDLTEKITEIETSGDHRRIIDYYYDNGNINYVSDYTTYVDKPVKLSSTDIESRYYFKNDCMVRYIYCSDNKPMEYTLANMDTYSSGTKDQYDYLEEEMINRAYYVYNIAPALEETQMLYGYVMDEFSMPMEDASIVVRCENDDSVVAEAVTDGDGFYKVSIDCADDKTYRVEAKKDTLDETNVYGITALSGSGKYAVEPIYMGYSENGALYPSQFVVRDATDPNKPLAGADVEIRRGLNNRTGETVETGQLDDNGTAVISLRAGSYTAQISKGGYETLFLSVIIRLDHQFAIGFAAPDVDEDTYMAVVSWEAAPLDLDTTAISSQQVRVIRSGNDSLGLSTAETLEIDNAGTDDYRIYVTDFGSITSNDTMSYNMTGSCVYVDVYDSEGHIGKYHVPLASAGVIWEAVEIHNRTLLPVNSYYYAIEDDPLWKTK